MLAQSDRFGNFAHGYTYAGHPVAAAVALEVQKIYAEMDIVAAPSASGRVLQSALGRLEAHPLVGDVRGDRPDPRHGADARRGKAHSVRRRAQRRRPRRRRGASGTG